MILKNMILREKKRTISKGKYEVIIWTKNRTWLQLQWNDPLSWKTKGIELKLDSIRTKIRK